MTIGKPEQIFKSLLQVNVVSDGIFCESVLGGDVWEFSICNIYVGR